jgi:glycosyltransferase involved in cell wall biosynthesis
LTVEPRVSVVVATHDRATVVGRAVESALAQTVRDVEVIVVDDHSADGTKDVLAALAARDARVRVIHAAPGEGGSAARARNLGLDAARAPVVAFLDDDDEWLPTKLARQLEVLDRRPDVVLVGCHIEVVRDGDAPVAVRGPDDFDDRELLWMDHLHGASCVAVRTGDERLAGVRFDESFPAIEDWDLYVRVAQLGAVARVPEVLVRYHEHEGERLTTGASHIAGHRLFLERHGARMTEGCRAYHRARLQLMSATGARENLRLIPRLLRSTPPAVLVVVARGIVSSHVGRWRGDPGLGFRAVHASLARRPRLLG